MTDPALVASTIASTLGMRDAGDEPLEARLKTFLRDEHLLLVLDNFEQVVEAAPVVADLLAACPALKVLVTSRVRLRVSGEHEHTVPPLEVAEQEEAASVEDVAGSGAVRLFVARARAVKADFALTPETASVVATICRRLDGLPLAIELAAARIKVLPPAALLARLEKRLPLLGGGGRDLPVRQQSMRDAIAWSYDLLSPKEQPLFRRLAVFVGGFTLEAAEAVVGGALDPGVDPFEAVASLVDTSLLRQENGPTGEPRYRMLEMVREFGLERLAASGEEAAVRAAHAAHFLALAERAVLEPHGDTAIYPWLPVLDDEHPNLRAALGWLAGADDAGAFLRLATRLSQFWYLRGHFSEGRRWLEEAVARAGGAPPALRAAALYGAGRLAHYQGDDARAVPLLEEALGLARCVDGSWLTPTALLLLGVVAEDRGQYARAEPPLQEALALYREGGHAGLASLTLGHLGIVAYGRGDLVRADQTLEEALALARTSGDPSPRSPSSGTSGWWLASGATPRKPPPASRRRSP